MFVQKSLNFTCLFPLTSITHPPPPHTHTGSRRKEGRVQPENARTFDANDRARSGCWWGVVKTNLLPLCDNLASRLVGGLFARAKGELGCIGDTNPEQFRHYPTRLERSEDGSRESIHQCEQASREEPRSSRRLDWIPRPYSRILKHRHRQSVSVTEKKFTDGFCL